MRGFAACILRWNESPGEASLLGGELALPHWGGSRQPLDRQIRYYSEAGLLARAFCGSRRMKASQDHFRYAFPAKSATFESGASRSCAGHWPPQIVIGRWYLPPCLIETSPAGLSLFRGRFVGGCSCRASSLSLGWLDNSQRLNITGAYL
jgi:hypothetical protein